MNLCSNVGLLKIHGHFNAPGECMYNLCIDNTNFNGITETKLCIPNCKICLINIVDMLCVINT